MRQQHRRQRHVKENQRQHRAGDQYESGWQSGGQAIAEGIASLGTLFANNDALK